MTVCDRCKDPAVPCQRVELRFNVFLAGGGTSTVTSRAVDLCDPCIEAVKNILDDTTAGVT